ncbi:hypothetical protein SB659_01745 [Arthrobacter sp. SIMBA_036]|uniref:hypothetical protein n=1 Tax=Arthrobacter sp. SIMBA_036 TaxID=3085778 RepID=UPI00397E5B3D
MRRFFPLFVAIAFSLVACTPSTAQPSDGKSNPPSSVIATPSHVAGTPSGAPSVTTEPSQPPSSAVESSDPAQSGEQTGDGDEPGRYAYDCTSLDNSPEVQLSSLAEVWAAPNYTRMASCDVAYQGTKPFQPTPRESDSISLAAPQGAGEDNGLAVMLGVLRLCTRISDETGPGGFKDASQGMLQGAAFFCPDAPQGKIIAGWANRSRVGDGSYIVGDTIQAGSYQLVRPAPSASQCSWSISDAGGVLVFKGGLPAAGDTVDLTTGHKFTSDKCGIWGKM